VCCIVTGHWTRHHQLRRGQPHITLSTLSRLHLVRTAVARGRGGTSNAT